MRKPKAISPAIRDVATIYLRVSTVRQEDNGTSLETQEERCREHCREQGWAISSVNRDVHTGAELDRPGLNRALADIREGRAGILLAYDLDRLSRDQIHTAVIFHQVESAGARAELVRERLDDTPQGRFLRDARAFAAAIEREQIKERAMRGKRARVTNGELVPVTFPLYGYAYSDDRRSFVIDEESAAVVRRIFDLYSRGNSIAKIVALLDQDGIPTPTRYLALRGWLPGGRKTTSRWVWGTVQYILHNRAYIGEYTSHGVSMRGVCPAIIDREVFERVQEQFSRNQQEATRNNKRSPEDRGLLARGYVVCGYCGHPMTAVYGKDRRARYRCRSLNHQHADRLPGCAGCTVAIERIDADVWGKVAELLTHPEYVRQVIERWQAGEREKQDRAQERIRALDSLIEKNKARRAKLINKFADDDDEDISDKIRELGREIQRLQAEREKITRATQVAPNWAELQRIWATLSGKGHFPYEEKRRLLQFFGVKVKVYKEEPKPGRKYVKARWRVGFGWDGLNNGEATLWESVLLSSTGRERL